MRALLGIIAALLSCFVTRAAEVRVFAAASLTEALKEIAATYEKNSGDKVVFNFGASNFLARQIDAGAPADVFFPADEAQMDRLETKGLIAKETRRNCLGNSLVIAVASDANVTFKDTADLVSKIKRLALADPAGVPAGIYAKKYLEKSGLWAHVSGKVIPTDNVRAALAAVEAGNADAAIVYKTDAAVSKKAKVALEVPAADAPEIKYPVAVLKEAPNAAGAKKFVDALFSPEARRAFEKFGFIRLP
jgi:molybdate transport system substrate-binding protein